MTTRFPIGYILVLYGLLLVACSKSDSGDPTPEPEPVPRQVDKRANLLATGDSANDLLSNANFDKLLIEVGFVNGFRPTQQAMAEFANFIRKQTFKEDIEIRYTTLDSPDEESLTLEEVVALEDENRTAYNDGTTLAIYIYFTDAPSSDDDEDQGLVTLGAVYRNTSMIIHSNTIRRLAAQSILISVADVESATLNHEFGHLFGLVDLGTSMVNDHQDAEAENHCNVEGCLMRAELQFTSAGAKSEPLPAKSGIVRPACSLSGASVMELLQSRASKGLAKAPELGLECVADLQGNGGR